MARPSSPVLALTAAALALPGISYARNQPTGVQMNVQTSVYSEKDQSIADVAVGDKDRYDIDIYQFSLLAPVSDNWSLSFELSRELMSGASPWGTSVDADDNPTLIMSGATIDDQRTEVALSLTRYNSNRSYVVSVESSREDDYEAIGFGIGGDIELNSNHLILSYGISYSTDTIEPTDALLYGRVTKERKQSRSLFVSFTEILSPDSQIQMGFGFARYRGFLSDPYKLRDFRPDEREEITVSTRYRRYYQGLDAALHLDYRFYRDDYAVEAHTLELAWHQNFGDRFSVKPSIRYYGQTEAAFYLPIDDYTKADSENQSSDYRLSAYGALSFGIKAEYQGQTASGTDWHIRLTVDRYHSDADLSHHTTDSVHPALIDFTMVSLGFSWQY